MIACFLAADGVVYVEFNGLALLADTGCPAKQPCTRFSLTYWVESATLQQFTFVAMAASLCQQGVPPYHMRRTSAARCGAYHAGE